MTIGSHSDYDVRMDIIYVSNAQFKALHMNILQIPISEMNSIMSVLNNAT